jgi:hypothetical protein
MSAHRAGALVVEAGVERVGSTEIAVREYPPGEDEIIAAFVKDLNQKWGAHYTITGKPDAVERNRPAVDYIIADPERPPEVAVEVSRTWRSEEAGKEDADWWKWVQRVRDLVRGQVMGAFRMATRWLSRLGSCPNRSPAGSSTCFGQNMSASLLSIGTTTRVNY